MASAARSVFRAEPYDYGDARRIAASLELAEPIAVMLVRRGHDTVEGARGFLEARDEHDPGQFEGMDEACSLILGHARRGAHVTVHGDYDVDGVCSTAILVCDAARAGRALRLADPGPAGGRLRAHRRRRSRSCAGAGPSW